MIRPQKKQQKNRQEMISSLKINDPVVTIGGIHGRITKIKEQSLTLRVADKVEVDFDKAAIARVGGKEE